MNIEKIFPVIFILGILSCYAYSQSNNPGTTFQNSGIPQSLIPQSIQSKILETVESTKHALVRIHIVEKYYSEGKEFKQEKFGSGVIISPEGYLVTNHHVAGKMFYGDCSFTTLEKFPLKLIGTDALTDVAVLKVLDDSKREFQYINFGDSDKVKVGDYVLAMGCPMALSPSVTVGIVSNTRMTLPYRLNSYDMFSGDSENIGSLVVWIGHSAEISSGSSGGPLVNLEGEIIGINEIKYGLGGAIPSNIVSRVVDDLINHGKVKRSWVGIEVQPVIGNMPSGALIRHIYPDSPADKCGLKPGDVLLNVGEVPLELKYMEQVPLVNLHLTSLPINSPVKISYWRDGSKSETFLTPEEYYLETPKEGELPEWGCTAKELNWLSAIYLGRKERKGVVITSLRSGGPASQAKPPLQVDDIIISVENQEITDLNSLREITEQVMSNQNEFKVLALVDRKGNRIYSTVKLTNSKEQQKIREASKAWIPIEVQVLTKEIAEKMNVEEGGFLVTRVYKMNETKEIPLKTGDIIKEIDDYRFSATKIEDYDEWQEKVKTLPVGNTVKLKILRDNREMEVSTVLEKAPSSPNLVSKYQDDWLGLTVRDLCFYDYIDYELPHDLMGVYIEQVSPGSWAALSRIEQGDVLISINNTSIESVDSFEEILEKLKKENLNKFFLKIVRKKQTYFVEVQVK